MLSTLVDAVLPPTSLAVLAFVLVLAGSRWRGWAAALLLALLLLSLPAVSMVLSNTLPPAPVPAQMPPQAIVLLTVASAPQDGAEPPSLDRMRSAAALARRTHLPILATGGDTGPQTKPPDDATAPSLAEDFGTTPKWQQDGSNSTWDDAERSARILRQAGIASVYLVTDAQDLRRATLAFRHFGLDVTPAPGRPVIWDLSWLSFVPRASAWEENELALHEWLGVAFYAVRDRLS